MQELKQYLEQYLAIAEKDWQYIQSQLLLEQGEKGDILTKQGHVENHLYFLCSGVARLFHEGDEKDITVNFGFPFEFISAYSSFLLNKKSNFMLQLLTPSTFIKISRESLEDIYIHTSCGHHFGRILTEKIVLYLSKRETSFMLRSPTERYLDLFEEHPRLIQEIPQKYLASYIGITPQALSRIRAKL